MCNDCIALQETKRGENEATHVFLTNSRQNWSFEGAAVSQARESCTRVRSLNSARFFNFRRYLLDMESDKEYPLFEIKLEDEMFIPLANKRVKKMAKEELL